MTREFEKVYTVTSFHDCPREGIADFNHQPHYFQSVWVESIDDYSPDLILTPVPKEVFQMALEDWEIWKRWRTTFDAGKTSRDTHPALPQDRLRHEELRSILSKQLAIDPFKGVRARGNFRKIVDQDNLEKELFLYEVCWELYK